jgi:L-ascorbate metabolism protein UlaG (beta-lactamase superfamily)
MLFLSCANNQKNTVTLHYLGHSSVYIDLGKDISVLCDYGKENAYLEWGWDSPIYDAGETSPDILCYSHEHADHYDEQRAAKFRSLILSGPVDTTIGKLHISSFESSERDISKYDNMSYLFTYKGIRVLHLGDCQADIMMINDPAHAWNLEQRYPKNCDILIMPIESTQKFILQAVKMAELLEPEVLIPTHYWSDEYKDSFIEEMVRHYEKNNKPLVIEDMSGAEYTYQGISPEGTLMIPLLTPSARIEQ